MPEDKTAPQDDPEDSRKADPEANEKAEPQADREVEERKLDATKDGLCELLGIKADWIIGQLAYKATLSGLIKNNAFAVVPDANAEDIVAGHVMLVYQAKISLNKMVVDMIREHGIPKQVVYAMIKKAQLKMGLGASGILTPKSEGIIIPGGPLDGSGN